MGFQARHTQAQKEHLEPLDMVCGFAVRPGLYEMCGATAIPYGVNFTVASRGAVSCELLLYHRAEREPYAVLPFPRHYKIGNVYSMIVFDLDISELEYAYRLDGPYEPSKGLLFDATKPLLDPYAKAVAGQHTWGARNANDSYRARVVHDDFDWGAAPQSLYPLRDLVIYELHIRGFTRHESSGVEHPGTFAGLREKIPYLRELGVNAVELMPIFEFDETRGQRICDGKPLLDYWGYNTVSFFAPNTSYASEAEYNREGTELKTLIHELRENGIEVILDVVFNHTAEGDENGPFFSFKGFDNNIYYMLTPNGKYYNFSGCGNTLNCNHPIVHQMILECLRYWVIAYRVSGFRFDLAAILGRNEDGSPMNKPPLLESLAFDPILGGVKLIAEAWDAGGLYQVGSFPAWGRWAEWNGRYRDDLRSFLKGDSGMAVAAARRIAGSTDLYDPAQRGESASVNFITCHDGFTLYDLYAYGRKHNESNGWNSTDGSDDNRSWNCGVEGETDDPQVLRLRGQLIRNALAVLLCSRGTPMFLAGDEFGNTQYGNNNAYCQDNEISWLNWSLLAKNKDLFAFCRSLIAFRKAHAVLRGSLDASALGFPDTSMHGKRAWHPEVDGEARLACVMFAGRREDGCEDIVYVAVNAHWVRQEIELPGLPRGMQWRAAVDTGRIEAALQADSPETWAVMDGAAGLEPRSVVIAVAEKQKPRKTESGCTNS